MLANYLISTGPLTGIILCTIRQKNESMRSAIQKAIKKSTKPTDREARRADKIKLRSATMKRNVEESRSP